MNLESWSIPTTPALESQRVRRARFIFIYTWFKVNPLTPTNTPQIIGKVMNTGNPSFLEVGAGRSEV